MKLAPNPLTAKALALTSPAGRAASPSQLDFGPLIEAAMQRRDAGLMAQAVELTMLKSSARLGSLEPAANLTPQTALLGNRLINLPAAPAQPAPGAAAAPSPALRAAAARPAARNLTTQAEKYAAPEAPAYTPPSLASSPRRQEIDRLIQGAAARHGVDPHLVRAVVTAESDFDPRCVSSAGAKGLMQLMPDTAKDMGVANPFDPAQNIEGGTRYLAAMLRRFDGDEKKALAAYNWGPSNVERGGRLPAETRTYLQRVARYRQIYAGGYSTKA